MCWATFKTLNKLTAEKDIPIFKVCNESIKVDTVNSYFKFYQYELNIIYKLNDKIIAYIANGHPCIDIGYHSYLTSQCNFAKDSTGRIIVFGAEGQFLGSYDAYVLKVAGYIPKNSEYYINEQGECVSDSICLTKIEEW